MFMDSFDFGIMLSQTMAVTRGCQLQSDIDRALTSFDEGHGWFVGPVPGAPGTVGCAPPVEAVENATIPHDNGREAKVVTNGPCAMLPCPSGRDRRSARLARAAMMVDEAARQPEQYSDAARDHGFVRSACR